VRVYVYVDGFNLYYRALRGTPHKWLNPLALAESVLDPTDQIDCIRYFTARVQAARDISKSAQDPSGHQISFWAISAQDQSQTARRQSQ
jgi:hypothetical protein